MAAWMPCRSPRKSVATGALFGAYCGAQHRVESEIEVAQSCLTLSDPLDCSQPSSSIHGIFQARIWSGSPFPSPEDLPDPGIEPSSPALQADALTSEPLGKPTDTSTLF